MLTMATRYPLDRLAERIGITLGQHGGQYAGEEPGTGADHGLVALAHRLGVTDRHLRRLRTEGLTTLQADRYAVACGWHPAAVWPGWDGDRDIEGAA